MNHSIDPAGDARAPAGRLARTALVIDRILNFIIGAALIGEIGVVVFSVLGRTLFDLPLLWADEAAKIALAIIAFVGGATAYRNGGHPAIDVFTASLPPAGRRAMMIFMDLLVLALAILGAVTSWPLLTARWHELTPILEMPATFIALPLTIGMIALGFSATERLLLQHRVTVLWMAITLIVLIALAVLTRGQWASYLRSDGSLLVALILFFGFIIVGVPVSFALLVGTTTYLYASGAVPLVALPQNMVDGTGNFVLLSLPFFILAGIVMERGGISVRLVRFVHALVGHMRGGLLQVMVVSMYLVSGISGSKAADVAAVGSVMRDSLRKEGYTLEEGAAVLSASAAMGETIPPSIAMLVLGSITTLSMAGLFIAGLVPAAVIAVCLMVLIYFQARKSSRPTAARASMGVLLSTAIGAFLPMLMPVFLFVGIIFGLATPTELSAFAVIYGVLLSAIGYRELGWKALLACIVDCAKMSGIILFILAAASSFSWSLTVANLPQRLVELLQTVHGSQEIFLLASCIFLVVIGSILEGLPALLILSPLLMPIAEQIGISGLHYGIILVIAIGIGAFIPPIGVGFYVACAVCGARIEAASRVMIPYVVVLFIGLLVVAYVPWFTLFLPDLFGFGG